MGLKNLLFGRDDRSGEEDTGPEYKTEEKRKTYTRNFTRHRKTITYPDGSTERIIYDERSGTEGTLYFYKHSESDFTVKKTSFSSSTLSTKINRSESLVLSKENFRHIKPDWQDEMVAVIKADVEVQMKRHNEGCSWYENSESLADDPNIEVEIWNRGEWEAYQEQKD